MSINQKVKQLAITSATGATTALVSLGSVSAQTATDCQTATGGIEAGLNCTVPDPTQENLFGTDSIFETVVNTMLFVVGAISVIMLIVGGIRYVVSAGDQNAVQGAKNTILYAIVGIVISFLAYALVNFVLTSLQG